MFSCLRMGQHRFWVLETAAFFASFSLHPRGHHGSFYQITSGKAYKEWMMEDEGEESLRLTLRPNSIIEFNLGILPRKNPHPWLLKTFKWIWERTPYPMGQTNIHPEILEWFQECLKG